MDNNEIPPGSAMEAWENFHKTVKKHGNYGIIAVSSLGIILWLVCMLVLSLLGIE